MRRRRPGRGDDGRAAQLERCGAPARQAELGGSPINRGSAAPDAPMRRVRRSRTACAWTRLRVAQLRHGRSSAPSRPRRASLHLAVDPVLVVARRGTDRRSNGAAPGRQRVDPQSPDASWWSSRSGSRRRRGCSASPFQRSRSALSGFTGGFGGRAVARADARPSSRKRMRLPGVPWRGYLRHVQVTSPRRHPHLPLCLAHLRNHVGRRGGAARAASSACSRSRSSVRMCVTLPRASWLRDLSAHAPQPGWRPSSTGASERVSAASIADPAVPMTTRVGADPHEIRAYSVRP